MSAPVELATWLGCLAFVAMLAKNIWDLFDRFKQSARPSPDPAITYLPRLEFQLHQGSLQERLIRVERQIEDARQQREIDHGKIYEKLDVLQREVASLTTASEHSETQLAQMVDRVDRLMAKLGGQSR